MRIRLGVGSAGPPVPTKPRLVGYLPVTASGALSTPGAALKGGAGIVATLGLTTPNALAATLAVRASGVTRIRLPALLTTAASGVLSARTASALNATLATAASGKLNGVAGPALRASLATAASGVLTTTGGSGFLNGYAYRRLLLVSPQADLTAETLTDFPLFVDSTEIPGDWSWLVTANGKLESTAGVATNPYSLASPPGYATSWALLKASAAPAITQLGTGVTLAAGPGGDESVNNIAIIAKTKPAPTWSVRFTTLKTDANQGVTGATVFLLFYAGLIGDGTSGFPADVSTWSGATEPYSHTFRDHCNGLRVSLYFQSAAASQSETQNVYVAPLIATTAAPVGVTSDPGSADSFPMIRGTSYDWVVAFDGTRLTVTQTDPTGTVRTNTYTNATLAAKAGSAGSFGLQCDGGRTVQVTGFAPAVPAGGTTAYDIRFHAYDATKPELAGPQLDHDYESFDGSAGTLRTFVRLPSWNTGQSFPFWAYYGKAGLGASEENVAGTWRGATMVIDPTTGADLTGRGRTFTRFGTLTNTTLDGRPAASMADQTGGYLRRTNADLLVFDSLPAVTEEFWAKIKTASSGNLTRLGGDLNDVTQTYKRARFSSWAEHTGSAGGKADVLQAGANWWDSLKYNNESTESLANIGDGTTVRHLIFVHQSNTHTAQYDGEDDISSTDYTNTPSIGTIHPQSYDNYSLGAGTGAQNQSPALTMGLYAVWPFGFSATRRAVTDRAQRDCGSVVSVGAEDAFGAPDKSPVGGVFRQTVTAQTDIDVLAAPTFDPDAADHLTVTGVTAPSPANASYTLSGGKVRVLPNAGTPVGTIDEPTYTISDGTKTAQAKMVLSLGSGVVGLPTYPDYVLPPPTETQTVSNMTQLAAAVSGISAGGHIVLAQSGTFNQNLTITRSVPVGKRIVIVGEKYAQLPGSSDQTLLTKWTGDLTLAAPGWVLAGVDFAATASGNPRLTIQAGRIRCTRFRIGDTTLRQIQLYVQPPSGPPVNDIYIDRFTIGPYSTNAVQATSQCDKGLVFSWFDVSNGQGQRIGLDNGINPFFLGTASQQHKYHCGDLALGLCHGTNYGDVEMKGSNWLADRLTFLDTNCGFRFRHGFSGVLQGCTLTNAGQIDVRDTDNLVLSCVATGGSGGLDVRLHEGNFDPPAWYPDMPSKPENNNYSPRPPVVRAKIVGCSLSQGIFLGSPSNDADENIPSQHYPIDTVLIAATSGAVQYRTPNSPVVHWKNVTVDASGNMHGLTAVTPNPLTVAEVGWGTPKHPPDDGGAMPVI